MFPLETQLDFLKDESHLANPLKTHINELNERGAVIIPGVLSAEEVEEIRQALQPHWESQFGRTPFEGYKTERIYALLAKDARFARLVEHPLILRIVDQFLCPSYLLWAAVAIRLNSGEIEQKFHADEESAAYPKPRSPDSMSVMWALDDFTKENGATEFIPGSHLWEDGWEVESNVKPEKAIMKAGSALVWKGLTVHRGGANNSDQMRLGLTTQYCQPWLRQVENMVLAVPPDKAAQYSERVREMLGYGILSGGFMGHVNGLNPKKIIEK